ncbi:hypothetical protein HI806_09450 [Ralstonia solanacearum]|nr:hypothetical protein BCR16_09110 [Ralstonia solanacearum FJAT-1458]QKL71490.1 hypothetical protein HI806_09450 [Ralstonia solanacearum]QKL76699.1 hypothetical protein HI805_09460 [Ralstonia solanacearum]QKL81903.1 hypothetical protein HI804_09460 [Ralstonia solanacearum]QKL87114.1 hypothetical protein HI803_09465 [Ralstonia solanacearum]
MTPEQAYAEAREQMPRRANRADTWSSRAVFWVAVRAGADTLGRPWAEIAERWARLWAVAADEHLPPIPGAAHVGAAPDVAAAEQNLERMRAMVGARRR